MLMNRGKMGVAAAFLSLALLLSGCIRATSRREVTSSGTGLRSEVGDASLTGVIVANDTTQGRITLQELGSDRETILQYNAVSRITDKYGTEITGEQLECGQIMEAKYQLSSARITEMNVPEDAWEYQEVKKFAIDSAEKSLQVAGRKYQYSDLTYIGAGQQRLELMELNSQDTLTVRGSGYTVYSIVRTKGHGYIRFANYKDFIGGMVGIGNGLILPITKNMLVTVREGTYRVLMSQGSMTALKTVTVRDGRESIADFRAYQSAGTENTGRITFDIEPAGAELTINGVAVDYSDPIALSYGVYQIGVTMNGYEDYTGKLDVERPSDTIHISLIDREAEVAENEATETPSSTDTSSGKDVVTKKIDSDHTITIAAPEGAEVYLDNVYKGLAPCTFTKIIGSQTLTLRRDGYITKSYSIDILDDSENVTLSFAELAENSDDLDSASTSEPTASQAADTSSADSATATSQ